MDELRAYYRKAIFSIIISLVIVFGLILTSSTIIPSLAIAKPVIRFVFSNPVLLVLFFSIEYFVRKCLWKLSFLNIKVGLPDLNFSGTWQGTTTYVQSSDSSEPLSEVNHLLRIDQDCLSLSLIPSKSDSFVNWGSLAITISSKYQIQYAYWVTYDNKSNLTGDTQFGYEELTVTGKDKDGRPNEMSGIFYQCFQGLHPIYRGTVKFRRERKKEKQ